MKSVLEELFYGNLCPNGLPIKTSKRRRSSGKTGRKSVVKYFISCPQIGHTLLLLTFADFIIGILQSEHQHTSYGKVL